MRSNIITNETRPVSEFDREGREWSFVEGTLIAELWVSDSGLWAVCGVGDLPDHATFTTTGTLRTALAWYDMRNETIEVAA